MTPLEGRPASPTGSCFGSLRSVRGDGHQTQSTYLSFAGNIGDVPGHRLPVYGIFGDMHGSKVGNLRVRSSNLAPVHDGASTEKLRLEPQHTQSPLWMNIARKAIIVPTCTLTPEVIMAEVDRVGDVAREIMVNRWQPLDQIVRTALEHPVPAAKSRGTPALDRGLRLRQEATKHLRALAFEIEQTALRERSIVKILPEIVDQIEANRNIINYYTNLKRSDSEQKALKR